MAFFRFTALSTFLAGTCLLAGLHPSNAEDAVLRPEIGQALQRAQNDLSARRYNQALADINAAEIIAHKTSYENYIIAQMKAAISAKTGNVTEAFQAFDALIKDPLTSGQEKSKLLSAEVNLAYKAKNYDAAAQAAERYLREIGPNEQTSLLLTQAFYLSHNWPKTLVAAQKSLEYSKKAGKKPSETQLQLMALAATHLKDQTRSHQAYILLAKNYPKPEYWHALIQSLTADHALSPGLTFILQRLRFETHNLKAPTEVKDMVERSVQLGHASLALRLLEQAHKQNLAGSFMTENEYNHFHEFIALKAQTEQKNLAESAQKARANTKADSSLKAGYNLVVAGQTDDGLTLMKEGLSRNPSHQEEALLSYGLAQMDAGRTKEALMTLKQLNGTKTADILAQLWSVALSSNGHQ